MSIEHVIKHFEEMGARVKVRDASHLRGWRAPSPAYFAIDVLRDRRGEYFDIVRGEEAPELEVLQVLPGDRHLLLYSRSSGGERFLCGHDERHWFVAAVEGRVSTVRDAKRSLMPPKLRADAARFAPDVTETRRNVLFKRQGEWFFVPVSEKIDVPETLILRDEPLKRNARSKPHICEELYRRGGRQVYVVLGHIIEESEYLERTRHNPKYGRHAQMMRADPDVFVRGYVRHPDHATIRLDGWHRVYVNGEISNSSVKFLD